MCKLKLRQPTFLPYFVIQKEEENPNLSKLKKQLVTPKLVDNVPSADSLQFAFDVATSDANLMRQYSTGKRAATSLAQDPVEIARDEKKRELNVSSDVVRPGLRSKSAPPYQVRKEGIGFFVNVDVLKEGDSFVSIQKRFSAERIAIVVAFTMR